MCDGIFYEEPTVFSFISLGSWLIQGWLHHVGQVGHGPNNFFSSVKSQMNELMNLLINWLYIISHTQIEHYQLFNNQDCPESNSLLPACKAPRLGDQCNVPVLNKIIRIALRV